MMNSLIPSNVSAGSAYQTAMEDLTKLLQDTGSSVERILSRYGTACAKTSGPEVLDVRTSLSIGFTPSILNNIGHTSPAEVHNRDGASGSGFGPSPFQTSANKAAHHRPDAQNWFVQKQPDIAGHGNPSSGTDAPSFNNESTFSDEDALRVLLEEVKKTVCDWLARQKVLVQDRASSTRGVGVGVGVGIEHGGVAAVRSPLHLHNGAPPPSAFKERSPAVSMEALRGTNLGEKGAIVSKNEKEKEETGHVLPQQDKETGHALFEAELQNSARLDKVVDDIASQLLQSDDEDCRQEQRERPVAMHTQDPTVKEHAAQAAPVAQVCVEQGSNSEATALATDVNASSAPASKDVTIPVADSFITPTKTDQTEVKLPLTKWKPPTSAAKTNDKNVSFPRTVEVIDSPDWLPEGWVTELKTRGSGNSAGSKDKYYVDPISHRRFRSRKEVVAYLERGKPKLSDSPETSPIKKLLGPEFLPSPPTKSHKKAKLKESSIPSSSALPPSMVPTIASPGLLGNMFMPPPYRTGQPSEWLVYESLASLPFPMFDPFYYADLAANKSGSSKGTHMPTRPWFFSGPEASWSPFMDRTGLGKSGDKGRDYHGYFSMPPYPSDAAKPSAGGSSKKSSKRKSTGL